MVIINENVDWCVLNSDSRSDTLLAGAVAADYIVKEGSFSDLTVANEDNYLRTAVLL